MPWGRVPWRLRWLSGVQTDSRRDLAKKTSREKSGEVKFGFFDVDLMGMHLIQYIMVVNRDRPTAYQRFVKLVYGEVWGTKTKFR